MKSEPLNWFRPSWWSDGVAFRCGVDYYIIFEGLNEQQIVIFDTDEAAAVLHEDDVRVLFVLAKLLKNSVS